MIHIQYLRGLPVLVNSGTQAVPTHMLFSSDEITPALADTSIPGQIGSRKAIEQSTVDANSITFTGIRTSNLASSAGDYINAAGLMTSSAGGQLWVTSLASSVLHTTNFDLEIQQITRFDGNI